MMPGIAFYGDKRDVCVCACSSLGHSVLICLGRENAGAKIKRIEGGPLKKG